jgi:glycosyltransferase involved in cell wall biosynthesis
VNQDFDVSIVIPAYNEEKAIATTLDAVKNAVSSSTRRYQVIVVNDGSKDRTAEEAASRGVTVLNHRRNRGYGASLKSGTLAARGDVVLFYDADNQFEPADIDRMVTELADLDAVLGARTQGSHAPFSRRGGKKVLGWLANYLARTRIPDLNCGLRAIRREVLLDYLHLLPNGFSASTTTTLVLLKEGHDVKFVPVTVKRRIGTSTVKPIKDGIDTALLIVRLTTLLDPFRVFGPVSIVFRGWVCAARTTSSTGRGSRPRRFLWSRQSSFLLRAARRPGCLSGAAALLAALSVRVGSAASTVQ